MTDTLQMWRDHATPFTTVVDKVQDWAAPSPCQGWSAADVLTHVIETQRDFLTDRGLALPHLAASDPVPRWQEHTALVEDLLADPGVGEQQYVGFFGPTSVAESLQLFYGTDLLLHRWDLARSQGDQEVFTASELAEIRTALDAYGEAAYLPGIFANPLPTQPGADEQTVVLALTGRRA